VLKFDTQHPISNRHNNVQSLSASLSVALYKWIFLNWSWQMTSQELATTTELKRAAPAFATIRQLAMRFRGILHGRDPEKLESWLDDAHRSGLYGLRRFAYTTRHDLAAVRNAIAERWSNGQTEGQINRLKTLKRQMYGRAGTETAARSTPSVCSRSVAHKLRKTQLSTDKPKHK
jgi:transposase